MYSLYDNNNNNITVFSTQVRHGCDATAWSIGPSGCKQTLLHRAVDENNEVSACFLVRRSANLLSIRVREGTYLPSVNILGLENVCF